MDDIILGATRTLQNTVLLNLLKVHNMTQTDLVRKIDVCQTSLTDIMNLKIASHKSPHTNPTVKKISNYFDILPEDLLSYTMLKTAQTFYSYTNKIETIIDSSQFITLQEAEQQNLLIDSNEKANEALNNKNLRADLLSVLSELSEREKMVLILRFGLNDGRIRTLEEIGKFYDINGSYIREIESKALRKLRHPSRLKKLKDYLK